MAASAHVNAQARESYQLPASFDPREYLSSAWSIWTSDHEPVDVILRFNARVARRVQETRWNRSEQVEAQPDGTLIWRAQIAEPKEMLPWIRGWGADVEGRLPSRKAWVPIRRDVL